MPTTRSHQYALAWVHSHTNSVKFATKLHILKPGKNMRVAPEQRHWSSYSKSANSLRTNNSHISLTTPNPSSDGLSSLNKNHRPFMCARNQLSFRLSLNMQIWAILQTFPESINLVYVTTTIAPSLYKFSDSQPLCPTIYHLNYVPKTIHVITVSYFLLLQPLYLILSDSVIISSIYRSRIYSDDHTSFQATVVLSTPAFVMTNRWSMCSIHYLSFCFSLNI